MGYTAELKHNLMYLLLLLVLFYNVEFNAAVIILI